jgi:hypothetical protein
MPVTSAIEATLGCPTCGRTWRALDATKSEDCPWCSLADARLALRVGHQLQAWRKLSEEDKQRVEAAEEAAKGAGDGSDGI